jgi:hypothetical protein
MCPAVAGTIAGAFSATVAIAVAITLALTIVPASVVFTVAVGGGPRGCNERATMDV